MNDAITHALAVVVQILDDDWFAAHVGPVLSCHEADAFASLLRAVGYTEAAEFLVLRHAAADQFDDKHVAQRAHFGRPRPLRPGWGSGGTG